MYDSFSEDTYMNDLEDNRLDVLFEMLAESLKQEQNEKSYDVMLPKVFKKYFDIHNDEINYDYYYNLMTSIIDEIRSRRKNGKISFRDYAKCLLISDIMWLAKRDGQPVDYLESIFALDFMYILSYGLYHDDKYEDKIIQGFKEILDTSKICQESYLSFCHQQTQDFFPKSFTSDSYYNIPIVMSVVDHLDDTIISKRVKKLLLDNTDINYSDLPSINKKQIEWYIDDVYSDSYVFSNIHEFAVVFILDYIKDKEFIAPFSGFVQVFSCWTNDLFLINNNELRSEMDTLRFLDVSKEEKQEIIRKNNECIDEAMDIDNHGDYIPGSRYFLFEQAKIFDALYFGFKETEELIKKHRDKIVIYINSITNEKIQFYEYPIDLRRAIVYSAAWIYEMVDKERNMVNHVYHIEYNDKENEIKNLKCEIESLKEKNETLRIENKELENGIQIVESKSKEILNKELYKNPKAYKQEISKINKELEKQKEHIISLQNEKAELNKLRELLFSLQENEEECIVEDTDVSLNQLIMNKTILFVGGHINLVNKLKKKFPLNLVNKLKKKFPQIRYISTDDSIKDNKIKGADYVFFYFEYLNHGLYYQVMNACIRYNIPWDYIKGTNIDYLENFMISKLK